MPLRTISNLLTRSYGRWFLSVGFVFSSSAINRSLSNMASPPVIIPPQKNHTGSVIFLHGLGDTGHGWSSMFEAIRQPHIKYICPTAPVKPVTLNGGMSMPSWFDIKSLDMNQPEDAEGIRNASGHLVQLIEKEKRLGIPPERIVVGGFSQGGALGLYSVLHYPASIAGIIACSCWLPLKQEFPEGIVGNKNTPVLQCHGDIDPLVPYRWGCMTNEILKTFMANVEFKTYSGVMHSSCNEEIADIKAFIDKCLPSL